MLRPRIKEKFDDEGGGSVKFWPTNRQNETAAKTTVVSYYERQKR